MILHDVKVHPSKDNLKREDQLAWKIAAVAADKVPVDRDVADASGIERNGHIVKSLLLSLAP